VIQNDKVRVKENHKGGNKPWLKKEKDCQSS